MRRPRSPLAASSLAFCLVLLDTSLVNVAVPTIRHDLRASVAGLQWIVNTFRLALATLLMSAGAFVDRYGARRLMFCGVAVFVLGIAVLSGLASSSNFVAGLGLPMALCALSFVGVSLVGVRMRSFPRAVHLRSTPREPVSA